MTETSAARYFAFISYSHRDKEFAEKLHRHLERYKLPSTLCKKYPSLPQNVRPVFRDADNLSAGSLTENLQAALDASRYLIVICSENSRRSNETGRCYVDEEIRHFLADDPVEKSTRIIPVVYRRDARTNALTCMSPLLRELDLLGIDVLEKGQARSFNDVVAALLGVDPDVLWQRWEREQAKKRRLRRALGTIAALGALLGTWYAYDYYTPHTTCYADYVECHNVPHGLFELQETQLRARHCHYRITTHKGFVREVVCCNSAGDPITPQDRWLEGRPAAMTLEYDTEGQVIRQFHSDGRGQGGVEWVFTGERFIDFQPLLRDVSKPKPPASAREHEEAARTITRYDTTRDAHGRIIQRLFCNIYKVRVQDRHGLWGCRYERDELGRIIAIQYLDREGRPAESTGGVGGYRFRYGSGEQASQLCRIETLNQSGKPALNPLRWSTTIITRDAHGNPIEEAFFGINGQPCLHAEGHARLTRRYDEQGRLIDCRRFGVDGRPL